MVGELAGQEVAQHVRDGDAALERRDLDAAAEVGRDIDRQRRREEISLRAVVRTWLRRPDPCVRIARPCREGAFGIGKASAARLTAGVLADDAVEPALQAADQSEV